MYECGPGHPASVRAGSAQIEVQELIEVGARLEAHALLAACPGDAHHHHTETRVAHISQEPRRRAADYAYSRQMVATQQQAMTTSSVDPQKRTVVRFPVGPTFGDPWQVIAGWAQHTKFLPRAPQQANQRLFQRGTGLMTAPMRALFTLTGEAPNQVMELQAYLSVPLITRIMALFMLPAEMHIRSGGFRAMLPRSIARKAVNELLVRIGQPPID